MDNQQKLPDYIYRQLQSGVQPDEVAQQLRTAGWDEQSIHAAFSKAQSAFMPSTQSSDAPEQPAATGTTSAQPENIQPSPVFEPGGHKRGRIKTAWILFKHSMQVLQNNKGLVRYPLMAGIFAVLITVIFVLVVSLNPDTFLQEAGKPDGETSPTMAGWGLLLVYYIVTSFAVFFYNAGLATHVLDIFRGQAGSYRQYIRHARHNTATLFFYSVITAIVGLILRILERQRIVGYIVSRIFGVLWNLANLFTIPIIVETDQSAPAAIKTSAKLFISRWGENIAARIGFGFIFFLLYVFLIGPLFTVWIFFPVEFSPIVELIIMAVIIFLPVLLFSLIAHTASQILNTALYYFAQYEHVPAAFSQDMLNAAFTPKKSKKKKSKKKSSDS